ncbi:MAG: cytochrome C oxidase Cbb3 [Gammaproteobacteria bacterium]|uniref:1-acyl-sn-glycerol-3-phosphate acyltransferase n=1 Tax=Pseudomaricurvus alcaniphilus TaxID=1166482 RepID=UPI00140BB2F9|nr:1-acyl-sn-glycerol-3-phosphate acyltransferase [Pseudomaricurvus alcaniphilus]MBR9908901.1 cytochrome C oxidase Cbb3 [Gammaproteobacteria bacterium]NHN37954.1 cytochrome C oxidase Cbb3 [Pseudomaricurvus alcaniphilus]
MTEFDDIRPYNDAEVTEVLARLLRSPELVRAIVRLRFPRLGERWIRLLCPLASWVLRWRLRGVHTVRQVQEVVAELMQNMISQRVNELTVSGLEKLDPGKAYLFISNHRDIAMDPAFVNYTLNEHGFDTVRIAIGDNLLTKPYVSDLMRLNKSFIVNRSAASPREKFKAAKHLSSYIRHSIVEDRSNIWIAQREGRAKDGRDFTNAAVISMLALCKSKAQSYADYINDLHIVPVSISYQWDPCDALKTNELFSVRQHGKYQKAEHEDVGSIALGIAGTKGSVHLAFGDVLHGDFKDAEDVAAAIDQQVWDNYVLHPSNHLAYEMLRGEPAPYPVGARAGQFDAAEHTGCQQELQRRLQAIPEAQRDILLAMYANPVFSKQRTAGQGSSLNK